MTYDDGAEYYDVNRDPAFDCDEAAWAGCGIQLAAFAEDGDAFRAALRYTIARHLTNTDDIAMDADTIDGWDIAHPIAPLTDAELLAMADRIPF